MKKSNTNTIRYISENEALVTKAFMKQSCIFGTDEFKLWREYLGLYPDAKMVTKTINKNPNKKTTRNKKYANMEEFIKTLSNSEELMQEFKVVKQRSKVKPHPYGFVLEWFETNVEPLGDFTAYSDQKDAERKAAEAAAPVSAEA